MFKISFEASQNKSYDLWNKIAFATIFNEKIVL